MVAPVSTSKFGETTGKTWAEWLAFLDGINAGVMSHGDIAQAIFDTGDATGWWSQSVAVAYEQYIGRRAPGQSNDGEFTVSASKTLSCSMDEALTRLSSHVAPMTHLAGLAITRVPETSASEKWRYWRCGLEDGSSVVATIYEKAPGKSVIGMQHEKLKSAESMAHWRDFWKSLLKEI